MLVNERCLSQGRGQDDIPPPKEIAVPAAYPKSSSARVQENCPVRVVVFSSLVWVTEIGRRLSCASENGAAANAATAMRAAECMVTSLELA